MAFTESSTNGQLNGATPVTIVSAPGSNVRRLVRNITIQNADTASVTLTVKFVNNATTSVLWSGTLSVGDTIVFGQEDFLVLDTTSKSITAVLGGAPATTQPYYNTFWADAS